MIKTLFFTLISLSLLIGCQGRGMPELNGERTSKTKQHKTPNDFPVLKVSTNSLISDKEKNQEKKEKEKENKKKVAEKKAEKVALEKKAKENKEKKNKAQEKMLKEKEKEKILAKKALESEKKEEKKEGSSFYKSTVDQLKKIPAIPSIGITGIPILNKVLPKPSETSSRRLGGSSSIIKASKSKSKGSRKSFTGGSFIHNLDIGMVRLGQGEGYTRLIFDSYLWEGDESVPVNKAKHSGTYLFNYEPKNRRIVGVLDGYKAFSALTGKHKDLYEGNKMVKTIHIDEYLPRSGFKFTIELTQEAEVSIYEQHNPGRIVIDMTPLK